MKSCFQKKIGFHELDADLTLRFKSLLNYFQEAVGVHTDGRGYGFRWLMDQGHAWVLHRIAVHIHRMPVLEDVLDIYTWHRGKKGFRAYRDFEILSQGEILVSATSLWLFIDLARKKILKVPDDTEKWYTIEPDLALDLDIDAWVPGLNFEPEAAGTIEIRPSDYDPLGHVNNALYFDFLEGLTFRAFDGRRKLKQVIMQFNKEIPKGVDTVEIGLRAVKDLHEYKLFSLSGIHAAGEFLLFPE